jgi:hypothetical protein
LIDYEPERIDASQKTSITRASIKRVILTVDGDGMVCVDQKNPFNHMGLRGPLMTEWE